jgi:hypothetical protein
MVARVRSRAATALSSREYQLHMLIAESRPSVRGQIEPARLQLLMSAWVESRPPWSGSNVAKGVASHHSPKQRQ